ncbi:MAG: helix-turn-helix domain-containing protein [Verrucomicrobiota bacterium]
MKAYSKDLREKIIRALESGMSQTQASIAFGVCRMTVSGYWQRYKKEGQVYCKQIGGYGKSKLRGLKTRSSNGLRPSLNSHSSN